MRIDRRTITDGTYTGGAAFIAVAIVYGMLDALAARGPLFTADLMGRVLFQGLRDPGFHMFPHQAELASVLCCAGLQVPVSLAFGVAIAAAVGWGERRSLGHRSIVLLLAAGGASILLAAGLLMDPLATLIPSASILTANGLAAAAATSMLLVRRGWLNAGR